MRNYQSFDIDLTNAGSLTFDATAGYLVLYDATNADGTPALDVLMTCRPGALDADPIKMRYHTEIAIENPLRVLFEWAAQPGVSATIFSSYGERVRVRPRPFKQLVSTASASGLADGPVTVGTTAVELAAANATRTGALIQNNASNSNSVWVGGSGVTTSDGVEITPGQSIVIDGTTAAIYGISDVAGQNVRVLEAS
jgi:hypothetical protein